MAGSNKREQNKKESIKREPTDPLTATEAAARLGVKRATLYAYISRGLLDRSVALDGRTSLFDPAQIDSLRNSRRRTAKGELSAVIASSITRLGEDGHQYRDQPVSDLLAAGLGFEEVADLIWQRPHQPENWSISSDLMEDVRRVQLALPGSMPSLDRLRVSVSVASANDALRSAQSSAAFVEAGRRMILTMAAGLGVGHGRPRKTRGVADTLWPGLTQASRKGGARATPERVHALETALVLLADHGLATSTFGVRVAASVRADPYSVVAAGLGSMGGVLHGSASNAVVRLLVRSWEIGAKAAVGERFADGERIPGFGHAVYRSSDSRESALMRAVEGGWADDPRLSTVLEVRGLVSDRIERPANIDLALGALAWLGHLDDRVISVFAIARTAGWIAHAIEEMGEHPVRFRPMARYVPNHLDPNRADLET